MKNKLMAPKKTKKKPPVKKIKKPVGVGIGKKKEPTVMDYVKGGM